MKRGRKLDERRLHVAEAIAAAASPWNMEALWDALKKHGDHTIREACELAGLDHHTFTRTGTECWVYNMIEPTGEVRKLGPVYRAVPQADWYLRWRGLTDEEMGDEMDVVIAKAQARGLNIHRTVYSVVKWLLKKQILTRGPHKVELGRDGRRLET